MKEEGESSPLCFCLISVIRSATVVSVPTTPVRGQMNDRGMKGYLAVVLVVSFFVGWATLVLEELVYMLLPHGPHFAPELGRFGAFIAFSMIFSVWYIPTFLVVAVPTTYLLKRKLAFVPVWLAAFIGAILFALACSLVCSFYIESSPSNVRFCSMLWLISGASCLGTAQLLLRKPPPATSSEVGRHP